MGPNMIVSINFAHSMSFYRLTPIERLSVHRANPDLKRTMKIMVALLGVIH